MFNIHNTVTVNYKDKVLLSKNSVIDAKTGLYNNLQYGKYIILGSGGNKIFKTAEINRVNSNIINGTPLAEFSVTLDGDENNGEEFSYFGLSYDGEHLVNIAEFDAVVKQEGYSLTVSIIVFLTLTEGSERILFGGNNPLVEFLLGLRTMPYSLQFYECDCNVLNDFIEYDYSEVIKDKTPSLAAITFSTDGININLKADCGVTEVLVFAEDKPVLRLFVRESNLSPGMANVMCESDNTICFPSLDISYVVNCSQGGISVSNSKVMYGYDKMLKVSSLIGYNVGVDTKVKGNIAGNYALIATRKEVMLYKIENRQAKVMLRTEKNPDDDFYCTENGYFAVFGKTLKLYGENGFINEFPIEKGRQNIITEDGAAFHYVKADKNNLVSRYKISLESSVLLWSKQYSGGVKLFKDLFSIGSTDGLLCEQSSNGGNNPVKANKILGIINSNGGYSSFEFINGLIYFSYPEAYKNNRIINVDSDCLLETDKNEAIKFFGDCLIIEGEKNSVYIYNRAKRKIQKLSGSILDKKFKEVCLFGGYLLAILDDGTVCSYALRRDGSFVYHAGLTPSVTANLIIAMRNESFQGFKYAEVNFDITV